MKYTEKQILDGDFIISIKKSSLGNLMLPQKTSLYVKKDNEFQQLGFVQSVDLSASVNKPFVDIQLSFPTIQTSAGLRNRIDENIKLLETIAVNIKSEDNHKDTKFKFRFIVEEDKK